MSDELKNLPNDGEATTDVVEASMDDAKTDATMANVDTKQVENISTREENANNEQVKATPNDSDNITEDAKSDSDATGDAENVVNEVLQDSSLETPSDEFPATSDEPTVVDDERAKFEKMKAEFNEQKAIFDEERAIADFEKQARMNEAALANVDNIIAQALTKAIEDMGIDPNKTFDEVKKEDPEKAYKIMQMAESAKRQRDVFEAQQQNAAREQLRTIVFTRASRLMEAFELNEQEMPIVAQAFLDILNEVGLKNLDVDLMAKVELAVGKAKLLAPKVANIVTEVKEVTDEVKKTVNEIMTPTPKEEPKEDLKEEEKQDEPVIDKAAFTDDATSGSKGEPIVNGQDLIDKFMSLKGKERIAFYKDNFTELEKAFKMR